MIHYATTIFVSAFLLFQVQPLISRYILPWFGGTPAVWSMALLFFQAVLLAGYAYAHVSITRFKPAVQLGVHLGLLGICFIVWPIIPPESLKPVGDESPQLLILLLLGVSVGLPYFALSASGPLLQAWFMRGHPGRSPYPLYALSNFGSLLALLSYPFVIEPLWGREDQAMNWSYLFVGFVALCAVSTVMAFRASRDAPQPAIAEPDEAEQHSSRRVRISGKRQMFLWIAFAATGATLLLAFTNQLCIDIATVPFLWVLPLSLYLLSFILTFAGEGFYPRQAFHYLLIAALGATCTAIWFGKDLPLVWNIVLLSGSLFVFCMVCHGEAYRFRPSANGLTKFYLCIASGGALGGAFVALAAPHLFSMYLEVPAGLLGVIGLLLFSFASDPESKLHGGKPAIAWLFLLVAFVGFAGALSYGTLQGTKESIHTSRNFYGVLTVYETPEDGNTPWARSLVSGTTTHGTQFMREESQRVPTSYFGEQSGVGLTLLTAADRAQLKVGCIGLGAGTIATYARPGDSYRFYEIDPQVIELANEYFYYLQNCEGDVEVVLGDARLVLEREEPQKFDVLILDAFSSDSIPVHLLTLEAFELYRSHLAPNGTICVHISNRHLDLRTVVAAAGRSMEMTGLGWSSGKNSSTRTSTAHWVILTGNSGFPARFESSVNHLFAKHQREGTIDQFKPAVGTAMNMQDVDSDFRVWTDDYSNLFQVLR